MCNASGIDADMGYKIWIAAATVAYLSTSATLVSVANLSTSATVLATDPDFAKILIGEQHPEGR